MSAAEIAAFVPGLGIPRGDFLWMLILGVVFFGIFTLVSGPLAEKWGRRKFLLSVTAGIFVFGLLGLILKLFTGLNIFSLLKYLGREFLLIVSTSSSRRSVALTSPSVTYAPNRPSLITIGRPETGSAPSSFSGGLAAARPRCLGWA